MLIGQRGEPAPRTLEELLSPGLAARLDGLDLLSRKILSGKLPGERRSKRRGRSVEFDDFRNYVPGDDLRHIDWNVYARLERLFIKLFREEEDLSLHIVVDSSPSMDAGKPDKLLYAARLAMALAYVGAVNQNRVDMSAFGAPPRESETAGPGVLRRLNPLRGRAAASKIAGFLMELIADCRRRSTLEADSDAAFAAAMKMLAGRGLMRGVVVLVSDFLAPGAFEEGLRFLGAAAASGGCDAYAVQVLSPSELDPTEERESGLVGDLRLTDVETAAAVEVTVTEESIALYKRSLAAHVERVKRACLRAGVAHTLVSTKTDVAELVLGSLRKGGLLR